MLLLTGHISLYCMAYCIYFITVYTVRAVSTVYASCATVAVLVAI